MCKRKPGPRCHSDMYSRLEAAEAYHANTVNEYQQALAKAGYDETKVDPKIVQAYHEADAQIYLKRREYYSTPFARFKAYSHEIPETQQAIAEAQATYKANRTPENRHKLENLKSELKLLRREAREGEWRWAQSKADLDTQEALNQAVHEQDYSLATYTTSDLARSKHWDRSRTLGKVTVRKGIADLNKETATKAEGAGRAYHNRRNSTLNQREKQMRPVLVRHVDLETPTFERAQCEVTATVTYSEQHKGFVVVLGGQGTFSTPTVDRETNLQKVGRSRLSNKEHHPPRNQIAEEMNTRQMKYRPDGYLHQVKGRVQSYKSAKEAATSAQKYLSSNAVTADLARRAREQHLVPTANKTHGIKNIDEYKKLIVHQRNVRAEETKRQKAKKAGAKA